MTCKFAEVVGQYFPAGHSVHESWLPAENVPAVQAFWVSSSMFGHSKPGGHIVHWVEPNDKKRIIMILDDNSSVHGIHF